MQKSMRAAYALISDFKRGAFDPGSPISIEQERLVRVLSKDLAVESEGMPFDQLVLAVANEDSRWNKRTMAAIDTFYRLCEAGKRSEAEKDRASFIHECPSAWYCDIVRSL